MSHDRDPLVVSHVVGDVLDPFNKCTTLRVTYNNREVTNGCEFKPSAIVKQPHVDVGGDNMRMFYTLVMVDPDAPSPSNPSSREYLHWMVTNIPATADATDGWRQQFNTREFAEIYELGSPVAALYFNCQREAGSGGGDSDNG